MKVLVINSGSSSIKYQLFSMPEEQVLVAGAMERIGEAQSRHRYRMGDGVETVDAASVPDHRAGLKDIGTVLQASGAVSALSDLSAVGHRVVHGGEHFRQPTRIDDEVLERIRAMIPLAPLHNPANLLGIEVALQQAPEVPQVAVFDTAFHQSIPPYAYRYALPEWLYTDYQVRRFGFHGTSHHYVAKQAAAYLAIPLDAVDLITLHLGNGASAAAVQRGKSIDTSMGMTPMEGLIMGSRCGDMDPAIPFYLGREAGMRAEPIEAMLNNDSGMKGICGANDMREIHRLADSGDEQARLALEMYCYRIKKYIGAYYAALGQVDAVVFTGGIGENDSWVRAQSCSGMEALGIIVDGANNSAGGEGTFAIHGNDSRVGVLVIPTNEELEIAQETLECLEAGA